MIPTLASIFACAMLPVISHLYILISNETEELKSFTTPSTHFLNLPSHIFAILFASDNSHFVKHIYMYTLLALSAYHHNARSTLLNSLIKKECKVISALLSPLTLFSQIKLYYFLRPFSISALTFIGRPKRLIKPCESI